MRRTGFTRTARTQLAHEFDYSADRFGASATRRLLAVFERLWTEIASSPELGRRIGEGRYRRVLPRERLVVLYRWNGGTSEDPIVVAVYSRRDPTEATLRRWFADRR